GVEVRLDEFGEPAIVVRLDRQQYDVELQIGGSEIAQMIGADRNLHVAIRHLDVEARSFQSFHLGRPLVDNCGVVARLRQIRADAAADCARAEYRDFLHHCFTPCRWFIERILPRALKTVTKWRSDEVMK